MTKEDIELYFEREKVRAKKNLYNSDRKAFKSSEKLAEWYVLKLKEQKCSCYYCETSIFTINNLIDKQVLKTRKVRGGGERGRVLEIDKEGDTYIPEQCVLSCYYCNNDKSYITNREDYKNYFGENRKKYFEILASISVK